MRKDYCLDFRSYQRSDSQEVSIGGIAMGSFHPIRIQSMTNTDTNDTAATVEQIKNIVNEGADYVRITVPNRKAAENLKAIKAELDRTNISVPLIADIHFNPDLAILAAAIVEKVRINPGNYRPKNKTGDDSDKDVSEIRHLKNHFIELLNVCKKHNTSIRIGTNHGSLSSRILRQYGDTPEGMVESAMEFLRICQEETFKDVVVSMKSSNARIMVYATRLLVSKMKDEDMYFAIHLGVTEAGEGEDGRIKSAVGIGTLLSDGIGDTIRVSLTEDPECEIPVARKMADYIKSFSGHQPIGDFGVYPINPYEYNKFFTKSAENAGGKNQPVVVLTVYEKITIDKLAKIGWMYSQKSGWSFTDLAPDFICTENWPGSIPLPKEKGIILTYEKHKTENRKGISCLMTFDEYLSKGKAINTLKFVLVKASDIDSTCISVFKDSKDVILVMKSANKNSPADFRAAIFRLINQKCTTPVIFYKNFNENLIEDFQLKASIDLGGLFIDGLGDGIWLENSDNIKEQETVSTSFGILQASRVRISKTEYISCPSCGRTLFDLQLTTREIREKTSHLRGLKIGIMGCIVNGPGEMADADYGFVGGAKGRITLYKEKNVVKKNVPEEKAVSELIQLIKENGDWIDP